MGFLRGLISLVACLALSAPALAATLNSVQGVVMVNRGSGYQTVRGNTELKPGDVVVVNPGGNAQITYPDGCSVLVEVGAVVTVTEPSPCATQASNGQGTGGLAGAGVILLNAGIAAGVVGIFLANQDKDKPASP